MIDKDLSIQIAVMEQHAEQLRAEVMDLMFGQGAEYTEAVSQCIQDASNETSINKRIFGMLADIGFCDVFARAGRSEGLDNDET